MCCTHKIKYKEKYNQKYNWLYMYVKMNDEMSVVDMLLDPDNESPITLSNDKGALIKLDQIAVIPLKDKLYAILKPITKVEGVGEDEALVFNIDIEEDTIEIVNDFNLIDKVFDIYYDLLRKEGLMQ